MSPGTTAGSRIRRSAANEPQPSTSAASSSSRGTASNEMRIMNMANGSWYMASTRLRPTSEFWRPMRVEQHVQRDQQRRVGHHEDGQRHQEQELLARELEPGEGVAAEERDHQRDGTVRTETITLFRKNRGRPAPKSNSVA